MEAWEEFLVDDDRRARFNDRFHGLSFSRTPGTDLTAAVTEYMRGFGHSGVTAALVASAVGSSGCQWVRRELNALVEAGDVRFETEPTRGPRASRRKVYFSLIGTPLSVDSMPESGPVNDWACGGGRAVPVLSGSE